MFSTATIAIGYASGYRYSLTDRKIYKVSIIHLVSDPIADIYINGLKQENKSPKPVYLEPGNYNLELRAEGYHPYFTTIALNSGELIEKKDISLFKNDIVPNISNANSNINNSMIDDSLINGSSLIIVSGHEIWSNGKLVTRFSKNIYKAAYYTNQSYIVYQDEDEIGAVRVDGSNNVKLFDYIFTNPISITFKNRGQTLELSENGKVASAIIN